MMARRGVVLVGALFALAACGDDDAGMDDGGTDSAIGTDAGPARVPCAGRLAR